MSGHRQVLIIDDHDAIREGLELLMRRRGHKTRSAGSRDEGLRILEEAGADLVITDLKMARADDGIRVLQEVKRSSPNTDVLVITAHGTVERAVEAMKLGACDFISKPFSSEEFGIKVDRILRERDERLRLQQENLALRVENTYLRSEAGDDSTQYGEMVGNSETINRVKRFVERVARSDSTVMVYGESGTGKELVARAIHARSARHKGPFVRVNCGALPEGLLDSELFGHERGAFTGAAKQRRGRFELADGGTLFLDEISTISPATQVRLLRVLQERELERVGGEDTIAVDVRIVAATNTPAEDLLAGDGFREDLYYRLHVVPVTVPPLRDRKDDIELLAGHFIGKLRARTRSGVTAISQEALSRLKEYDWPGNVRELENVIERALVLADGEKLEEGDLPLLANGAGAGVSVVSLGEDGVDLGRAVEGMEERLIRQALARTGGAKAEAARLLSIPKSRLYYKIEKYGID
ncbi:MAG: sigma-54 dependent transcriptional regulator [Gemmatimonadetes bacterium]|nr:sigma-54 dependent transcriptional regulator [Gemmatimonadota bacterium]MCY3678648.1 sigma-54 dependent transcriptional regulator [Gemmatimonadota bacterium]MYA41605.1 sigma-54-dependent Fis family transcriptional regulator [Gemmatimonadota bacterium]MYE95114.1 sigma-54-dependent Fis family transcriptional regulator [Gemmatimonadota bacterium]MYJ09797.1 sigma-54-dependent Fis family transcriptional regulator [Gemmatimonadota bacterium]